MKFRYQRTIVLPLLPKGGEGRGEAASYRNFFAKLLSGAKEAKP
jgi:hypothetical protein